MFEIIESKLAIEIFKKQYNKKLLECLEDINKKIIERSNNGYSYVYWFLGIDTFNTTFRPELISKIINILQTKGYIVNMEMILNHIKTPINCRIKIDWRCDILN